MPKLKSRETGHFIYIFSAIGIAFYKGYTKAYNNVWITKGFVFDNFFKVSYQRLSCRQCLHHTETKLSL